MKHPLRSAAISIVSPEISNFCYIKKYRYTNSFNFFYVFKDFFNKSYRNFDDVSKIGYSRSPYGVITSVSDFTNKILQRDSNYIVDVVMWPKFGNSSISMMETIITSVL